MKKNGLALIGVIIVLAVLSILAGVLAPLIFKSEDFRKERSAESELKLIYKAILGDFKNSFGYLGDMGIFPQNLKDLYLQGNQPSSSEAFPGSGVYYGWKGPYISLKNCDSNGIIDPYGNYYLQFFLKLNSNSPCESTDTKCRWFLMSEGKDRAYNSSEPLNKSLSENKDNIYYPTNPLIIDKVNSYNTILVNKELRIVVSRASETLIKNVKISAVYSNNGTSGQIESNCLNPVTFNLPAGEKVFVISLENDNGDIVQNLKTLSITFAKKNSNIKFLRVNTTNEALEIDNLNFSSLVCPTTTCTGICAWLCCNPSLSSCRNSTFWMYWCQLFGCYSLCCSGSGGTCSLDISVNSNLNSDGINPHFDLVIEGFDSNGVKVLSPSHMQKNSSSPFFHFTNNSVSCNLKTIRIYSTGGGAILVRNL